MKTKKVIPYSYNRGDVKAGILHIGVGNFHRAHQEFFTNELLSNSSQHNWGICGLMLLESDKQLYETLKKQNNEYTLSIYGRDGKDKVYRIGSLIELIWGVENVEKAIAKIADKNISIITLTITQNGYNIDKSTGAFILENENIQHDIANPKNPKTTFGFVAEGLRRRKALGAPVTILSCDNLRRNGDTSRRAFASFFKAQDPELAEWVEKNVTFPNCMVDRITPATRPDDIIRLNEKNGTNDDAPVYCEDFLQWVIEDNFIAGRPSWENVGVEFTSDVSPYENMKLNFLNASHTLLSYPSFLGSYRKVDEAMRDKRIEKFVRAFMDEDITPYVSAPKNANLSAYKQILIERFGNSSVSDQLARLCSCGTSKFPVFIMPNLIKMIRDNADIRRIAYLFAAYRHYLKYKTDDNGNAFEISEPYLTADDEVLIKSDKPLDFLRLSAFGSADLSLSEKFSNKYLEIADNIKARGAMFALEEIL